MDEYERILLIKPDVYIYKIPPRTTNRAHRAADWKLDEPDWTGRLRLVSKGKECVLKLEDKTSGELFAKCPVDKYPGIAIEAVSDSSRYFVIRLQDDNGRNAFIGMGFSDRGDSFDLNVTLQDHFKLLQKEEQFEKEPEEEKPKLDLGFKEGQTIKVNLNIKKSGSGASTRPKSKTSSGGGIGILPPPPGGIKIPGPSVAKTANASSHDPSVSKSSAQTSQQSQSANDLLLDLDSLSIGSKVETSSNSAVNSNVDDLWSDFAASSAKPTDANTESSSWAQF